jgi:hypothetical protein
VTWAWHGCLAETVKGTANMPAPRQQACTARSPDTCCCLL